jgi:cullin 3
MKWVVFGSFDESMVLNVGYACSQEIRTATSMQEQELQRNLQSLACAKYKVLKKHPPGRDIKVEDSFSFNHDFTCNLQRIKISTISSKVESSEERKETKDRVEEERRHQIDVSIIFSPRVNVAGY